MKRRTVLILAAAAVLDPAGGASAQTSRFRKRLGIFTSLPLGDLTSSTRLAATKSRLRELGWVEGENIAYDVQQSNPDPVLRLAAAKELVARKPDLIITSATPDTIALLSVTRTIPVVFSTAADPVDAGFVQSLARPGGNATGLTNSHASMGGKWLEILKELAPKTVRVGVLFNPETSPRKGAYYAEPIKDLAATFGIEVVSAPIENVAAIAPAVAKLASGPAGGLIVTPDSFTVMHRAAIVTAAAQHRVPAVYPYHYFVVAGGLVSYGFSNDASTPEKAEIVLISCEYIDLILRGANPAELPVRSPRNYELLINLKAAQALGLTIPPSLRARADKILE